MDLLLQINAINMKTRLLGDIEVSEIISMDAAQVDLTDLEFAELEDALAQCQIYGHRGLSGF